MRNNDLTIEANNNTYADVASKMDYLTDRYGFQYHKDNMELMFKNELIFHHAVLYNYDKSQCDILNFLAEKMFVHDPFILKGYQNEFISIKYEDMHTFSLKEIEFEYNESKENFYKNTKLN